MITVVVAIPRGEEASARRLELSALRTTPEARVAARQFRPARDPALAPADLVGAWASAVRPLAVGERFAILDPACYVTADLATAWAAAVPRSFTLAVPRAAPRTGVFSPTLVIGAGGPRAQAALLRWQRAAAQLAMRPDRAALEARHGSVLGAALELVASQGEDDGAFTVAALPASAWARPANWCGNCDAPQHLLANGDHACPGPVGVIVVAPAPEGAG